MNLDDRAHVDAACWIVEDDEPILHQRLGDDDFLLVAAREFNHP